MDWTNTTLPHAGGFLSPEFSAIGDAFAANFEDPLEIGAGFAVMIDGVLVADIHGGFNERKKITPWSGQTLTCIYSCGKAVLSFLVAREICAGALDYDAPVAAYWPAFGANGKAEITIAQAMSHQAGLCALPDEMPPAAWLEWETITAKLAAMAPLWPPGSASGYHPQTVGFIIGEVLRRATGKTVGQLLAELNQSEGLQIFCGLTPAQTARTAHMRKPPSAPDLGPLTDLKRHAFLSPWAGPARVSHEAWMAAEIPASNMHANAASLAAVMHPFANGGRWGVCGGEPGRDGAPVLSPAAIEGALRERSRGDDLVLPFELSWTAGLMRNINRHFGPNENAYGHAGFGGSCIVVDPQRKLTAAYVMNAMSPHLVGDPRALRLLDAVYACIA